MADYHTILGIRFFSGEMGELLPLLREGGLVVVPSGPNLASELVTDAAYREAVQQSDIAITDSGLMVLLWRFLTRARIERLSGLKLIRGLLDDAAFCRQEKVLWVMPNAEHREALAAFARERNVGQHWTYTEAPFYPRTGPLEDPELARQIEEAKFAHVVLCIAGGTQERLGHYLRSHLSHRPAILCTGAAIAFLTGQQADIPPWADRWMLGWLFRCFREPSKFIPRYWKAQKLFWVMLRHRANSPA